MGRVCRVLVVASVLVVAALPIAGASTSATRSTCQHLKGKDLAPAVSVKLVERRMGPEETDLVGCTLPRGRVRTVADRSDYFTTRSSYSIVQITGRIVLVRTTVVSQYYETYALELHDLRTGRKSSISYSHSDESEPVSAPAIFATGAGRAIAVVVKGATATVTAYSTLGRARTLDTGTTAEIPPESLRLHGNAATWTHSDLQRSASLLGG
jgi:hypothetical protein